MSQHSSDTVTPASQHGDNMPSMNCSYTDMSPAVPNNLDCSNTGIFSPLSDYSHTDSILYSSLDKSELNAESGFDAKSSADEIASFEGQEKCFADCRQNDDNCRVDDFRPDKEVAASKRSTVEIDRNCNELFLGDCRGHDWYVDHSENEQVSFHHQASDDQTSPSVPVPTCTDDGLLQSDTLSWETNIVTDSACVASVVMV